MTRHILFAVSSLGLGHATRSLPIIKSHAQRGWTITVLSHGNALHFLQEELQGRDITFIELEDYPKLERGSGLAYFFYLAVDLFATVKRIRKERAFVGKRQAAYDCIVSDGRYGVYSDNVPSFIISHQLSFVAPKYLGLFRSLSDRVNRHYLSRFDKVFIPDFPKMEESLAGALSHNRVADTLRHCWVGILSSYTREEAAGEIDALFILSGYLQEHKASFAGKLIEQAKMLPGAKVFVLGDTSGSATTRLHDDHITIYPVAFGRLRNALFNRARLVVSRSGYTTIMDLAELDKPAVLFATPNQTEQEYLADFLGRKGFYVTSRDQDLFDLPALVEQVRRATPFKPPWKTAQSLRIIQREINARTPKNKFSIIVPAHNEERYIGPTLERLAGLDYPGDGYEVIVVENGSTDATWEVIQKHAAGRDNMFCFRCEQGVSRARNKGLAEANPKSDWIIFLDADTILLESFLLELNRYLGKHRDSDRVVGTASIRPSDSSSARAKRWFRWYDTGHKLTSTSYSLQIVRADVAGTIRYDEELDYSEDLKYIKEARRQGSFFFLRTGSVLASARRFEKHGYLRQTLLWLYQALQPAFLKKKKTYRVVR